MAEMERTTTPPQKKTSASGSRSIKQAIDDLRATGVPGEAVVLTYQTPNSANASRYNTKLRYGADDLEMYSTGNQLVIKLRE